MQCMAPIDSAVAQLRRGVLEYCVLALLGDEERYGYDLVTELSDAGLVASEGTIYPLLSRLRKDELVATSWQESPSGPPRRYYRLTRAWPPGVAAVPRVVVGLQDRRRPGPPGKEPMTTDALHPLTSAYLEELRGLAQGLPPEQSRELVDDIRDHVTTALRPDSSEAEVRETLDRLGTPAELVAAAGPMMPATQEPSPPAGRGVATGAITCLILAELMVILWPLAALVWVAGVILLVLAQTWTAREKVLGVVGLASGFPLLSCVLAIGLVAGGSTTTCTQSGPAGADSGTATCTIGPDTHSYAWLALAIGVAYLAFQAYTVWRLTRARRTA